MNDRFKFRVFCKSRGDYVEKMFDLTILYDGRLVEYDGLEQDMDNHIIEQCTGLKDKNGNLIYEGDIVRDSLLGRKYTVKWDCDNVQFEATANVYDTEFSEVYGLYVDSAKELEIIGNIHEKRIQNE